MNFQAPSRFFAFLNTAQCPPPMKLALDVGPLGSVATPTLSLTKSAPPAPFSSAVSQGPEMSAAVEPATNCGSISPRLTVPLRVEVFDVKNDW